MRASACSQTGMLLVACLSAPTPEAPRASDAATPVSAAQESCRVDSGLVTVAADPSTAQPLVVLFERNPWLMAIGSDFPAVVVYEDGRILFVRGEQRQTKSMSGHIEARAARLLRDELIADGFMDVAAETNCSDWTDQDTVEILVRRGESWKVASAYGIGRDGTCKSPAPKAFVDAYSRLLKLNAVHAKPFEPEEIEVMIWGFEYARGNPVPWPTDVPAPPASVVPEEYAPNLPKSYNHVLQAKFRPQIARLVDEMESHDPPRAMLLNGHKWSVVPRWLWPGYRVVEDVIHCAHRTDALPRPPE